MILRFKPEYYRIIHHYPEGDPDETFGTRKEMADYLREVRKDHWPIRRRAASFTWADPLNPEKCFGVAMPVSASTIERFVT